ncbi:hypothetical protein BC833DRAFT_586894 [Globomyces pollinis-pini]|nr:hypothetical protein BC833DRAFT_586894 [Globomyces pollinis-pini]
MNDSLNTEEENYEGYETANDLATITMNYNETKYSLFLPNETTEECLFDADYNPLAIDMSISVGESYNQVLFNSSFYFVLVELKEYLKIENEDISIKFPQLNLTFHQDHPALQTLTAVDFQKFLAQLLKVRGMEESEPLELIIIKHENSTENQLKYLNKLCEDGGILTNYVDPDNEYDEETDDNSSNDMPSENEYQELEDQLIDQPDLLELEDEELVNEFNEESLDSTAVTAETTEVNSTVQIPSIVEQADESITNPTNLDTQPESEIDSSMVIESSSKMELVTSDSIPSLLGIEAAGVVDQDLLLLSDFEDSKHELEPSSSGMIFY